MRTGYALAHIMNISRPVFLFILLLCSSFCKSQKPAAKPNREKLGETTMALHQIWRVIPNAFPEYKYAILFRNGALVDSIYLSRFHTHIPEHKNLKRFLCGVDIADCLFNPDKWPLELRLDVNIPNLYLNRDGNVILGNAPENYGKELYELVLSESGFPSEFRKFLRVNDQLRKDRITHYKMDGHCVVYKIDSAYELPKLSAEEKIGYIQEYFYNAAGLLVLHKECSYRLSSTTPVYRTSVYVYDAKNRLVKSETKSQNFVFTMHYTYNGDTINAKVNFNGTKNNFRYVLIKDFKMKAH
jgi:hypothetical protein